jgi:Ras family protein T1
MGVYNDGLTLEGFLFLNKLFILRGRHETTWKVLRRFGYNNSLNLRPDYLYPLFVPQADSNVELSEGGIRFLTKLFNKHDKDGDNALCPNEQEELFSICPQCMWDDLIVYTVETNSKGWVTLEGFLAFWVLQTYLDFNTTTLFLAYMGYSAIESGGLVSAIREVPPHGKDRTVYRCMVAGGRGCGKTSFCRSLVVKSKDSLLDRKDDDIEILSIKSITSGNSCVYIILHECVYDPQESGPGESINFTGCELVCFLYDTSERTSFQSIIQLFVRVNV